MSVIFVWELTKEIKGKNTCIVAGGGMRGGREI